MKKFLTITLTLFSTFCFSQSPNYVDFEWDILRFGYVIPTSSSQAGGGLVFGGELRYNATDNFSIGISGDGALFGTDFEDADIGVSRSSLIVGDYYFRTDSGTRPFAGLGLGIYGTGDITVRDGEFEEFINGTTGFGFALRGGYEFGHVRLQGQYNFTVKEGQSNYFGLTVALTLWGGYKGNKGISGEDY